MSKALPRGREVFSLSYGAPGAARALSVHAARAAPFIQRADEGGPARGGQRCARSCNERRSVTLVSPWAAGRHRGSVRAGRSGGRCAACRESPAPGPGSGIRCPRLPRGCSARPSAMMTTGRPAAVGPPPSDVIHAASSLATASQANWRSSARPWRCPKQQGLRRRTTRRLHRDSHGYSSAARIASRPSVSAAGPGCRISGDLISKIRFAATAGI
jgi:hypothetical protein